MYKCNSKCKGCFNSIYAFYLKEMVCSKEKNYSKSCYTTWFEGVMETYLYKDIDKEMSLFENGKKIKIYIKKMLYRENKLDKDKYSIKFLIRYKKEYYLFSIVARGRKTFLQGYENNDNLLGEEFLVDISRDIDLINELYIITERSNSTMLWSAQTLDC